MKEIDYINATNLANLRIACATLRNVVPLEADEKEEVSELTARIYALVRKYEGKV